MLAAAVEAHTARSHSAGARLTREAGRRYHHLPQGSAWAGAPTSSSAKRRAGSAGGEPAPGLWQDRALWRRLRPRSGQAAPSTLEDRPAVWRLVGGTACSCALIRTFPSTGMGGLLALLQRAAQAAAFLAVLAPAAAPGGGGVLPAEPDVLLPELAAGLPKGLQAKLRGLSLQDLVAPLIKDAQGKPQPGKWDADVDTKLPKAVFMRLGELCGAEAGAAISTRLQRGSMGKRPAA